MSKYDYSNYTNKRDFIRLVFVVIVLFIISILFIFKFKTSNPNYNLGDDVIVLKPEDRNIHQIHFLLPKYKTGDTFVIVNNNNPLFKSNDLSIDNIYESYTHLDEFGRVGVADVILNKGRMSINSKNDISEIKPTGWSDIIEQGDRLYNRTHLIGFQLTEQNDNPLNLMTGTRFFNTQGMLPIENIVSGYLLDNPDKHVRYRVTPLFVGNNLLSSGAFIEALSIEDNGNSLKFHVFVPNYLPGTEINYMSGSVIKRSLLDYIKF